MNDRTVAIFGGGTISHVRSHLALSAPAYGSTAYNLQDILRTSPKWDNVDIDMHLTAMADPPYHQVGPVPAIAWPQPLVTNADVEKRLQEVVDDPLTRIVFFNVALCDWEADVIEIEVDTDGSIATMGSLSGKYEPRLETKHGEHNLRLVPAKKLLPIVRQLPNSHGIVRKDILLVAFKTTCGATSEQMYHKGLELLKKNSCNLVLVNDVKTRVNLVVTPEESCYHETTDRQDALEQLVDMAWHRSQLTFTRSTVVAGDPVPWGDPRVPASLRAVVDHCIKASAYKPFLGATVGHFACRLSETEFLTSIRKSDFNRLSEVGLVYVKTDGPDTVLAYGAKPSVGGQSQRTIFRDHPGFDCVVHAHVPLRPDHPDDIPVISQRENECGSMRCGEATSGNLKQFGTLKAVMLDQHGPNIVFPKHVDPQLVIDFIDRNFDLSKKTGGYQLPMP